MKKFLKRCMLVLIAVVGTFAFAGCLDGDDSGGGTPEHTHSWKSTKSYNSVQHWIECSTCSEKKDIANHSYQGDVCAICGYNKSHTHSWPDTYTYNDSEHWKVCSTCFQETSRVEHDYENNICKECGHQSSAPNYDEVTSVRDLEIITFDTGSEGLFTLVKLPDGKNMVIDAGDERFDTNLMVEDTLLYAQGLSTIDYFVLSNTKVTRTGQAAYIMRNFEVKNLFTPRVIGSSAPSCYTSAVAMAPSTCTVKEVDESNCDIMYSFREKKSGAVHTYSIDFMLPADTANCTSGSDASVVISIEYKGKVVLITSDATQANIDGYCTKYGDSKSVDVLITSFLYTDPYAITNSVSRGHDYLSLLSLDSNCYAIISPISAADRSVNLDTALVNICGRSNVYLLTDQSNLYIATVKITSTGVVSVTAE